MQVANTYLRQLDQSQKLKELYNRKNYTVKIKSLHEKINAEYNFWLLKEQRFEKKLEDLKKDLNFIISQVNASNPDKSRIDQLFDKYGLK